MSSEMSTTKNSAATSFPELPASFNSQIGIELIELFLTHRGSDFQISGANVRRFGAQYLQILLAAHAAWSSDNHTLIVWPMSDELMAGLALLGVSPDLLSRKKDCVA